MEKLSVKINIYLALGLAIASLLGSLYFSEIRGFTPCDLCWWQRVYMYPLVVIILVGVVLKDKKLSYYGLPLSILGLLTALYQNLLVWGVLRPNAVSCAGAVSCATRYINWFGFISIPFLSLLAFIVITACLANLVAINKNGHN